MAFSHEEKMIWNNSDTMKELEKIALEQGIDVPDEANMPLHLNKENEEEWEDENKLVDAAGELLGEKEEPKEQEDALEELLEANQKLIGNLQKISYDLVDNKNIQTAYKVENIIRELQTLLQEDKND